jgi:hypothetical protein
MLFFAMQLLCSHFPNSPLIGEIRSTMKSYGRTSMVLGASTKLYNELIRFHWRGQDDLASVVELLKEMEVTGTEPDSRTLMIVQSIVAQRKRDKKEHGMKVAAYRRRFGKHPDGVRWVDTEPNKKALRELQGSPFQPGWIQCVLGRLREIEFDRTTTTKWVSERKKGEQILDQQ